MRNITIFFVISFFLCMQSTNLFAGAKMSFLIQPGKHFGQITSTTTEKDLVNIFGANNVDSTGGTIKFNKSETDFDTKLFSNEANKTLFIVWKDKEKKKDPELVFIKGTNSEWKTSEGITLGTTIKELETLNNGPFDIIGFYRSAEGTIRDWKNGQLSKKVSGILIRLNFDRNLKLSSDEQDQLSGGGSRISSSNPVAQKLKLHVDELEFHFN